MSESFLYQSTSDQVAGLEIAGRPTRDLISEIQCLYQEDARPWVIGFSGGKDSTATLQLIYTALIALNKDSRQKPVFVVSSDTLVETPLVVDLIKTTLIELDQAATDHEMPIEAHQVVPRMNNTFWVNLIGKGYPAPTQSFRWCTERMKIDPVSEFILEKVADFGEVVVVLGSRSQESSSRAQVIAKHRINGSLLGRHTSLPNAYVYMPIEDWSADDVWEYLMSAPRPWGGDNRELLELYRGSNAGECPVVIDTSTPSCGNSRFGCWTCTVVTTDKAMESLVEQGEAWMKPLLDFRNKLAHTTDPAVKNEFRNFKRRTGKVTYARGDLQDDSQDSRNRKHVPGPYWMSYRKQWLEELLRIEKQLNESGHPIELVTREELHHIRREWLNDPNEPDWEDCLPAIYKRVFGKDIDWVQNDAGAFTKPDADLLEELEAKHGVSNTLVRKLMELEVSMDGLSKRKGMSDKIHSVLTQDWEDYEILITREQIEKDGGYQEEMDRLQAELDELNRITSE
ncbi:MAG: DNA phosphorothioation system sulfurtransferase DndC [Pseudomonadales bacterium]